jgi:hypothetical protein
MAVVVLSEAMIQPAYLAKQRWKLVRSPLQLADESEQLAA